MAKSISLVVVLAVTIAAIAFAPAETEAAIQCDQVGNSLNSCLTFVVYGIGPSPQCCQGVTNLWGQAQASQDRRAICKCIKNATANLGAANPNLINNAKALPGRCGLNIGYEISPNINCDRIN